MRALMSMAMPVDQAMVGFFMTFSITPLRLAPTLPRYAREGTRQRSFADIPPLRRKRGEGAKHGCVASIPSLAPQARGSNRVKYEQ